MEKESSISRGIIGGVISGILCIVLWCLITYWTEFENGLYALGVGAIVGFAVRWMGRGEDKVFGIVAAICAVLSCLASELILDKIIFEGGIFADTKDWIMSILFYVFAAVEAYKIVTNDRDKE